jgi:uncharacterized protein (DUF302 family)
VISPKDISAVSSKSFEDTVDAIEQLTAEHGFRVLHVHDIQTTLKEKGFDLPPFKIIEICNAKYAHALLTTHRGVGLLLPCKINVYVDDERNVIVSGVRPTAIQDFFLGIDLGTIPQDVEIVMKSIIERAIRQ